MVTQVREAGAQLAWASPWIAAVPVLFPVHHLHGVHCLLETLLFLW